MRTFESTSVKIWLHEQAYDDVDAGVLEVQRVGVDEAAGWYDEAGSGPAQRALGDALRRVLLLRSVG